MRFNLSTFRHDYCVKLVCSLETGRAVTNLQERSRALNGNTRFTTFVQSTYNTRSPIGWLGENNFLDMRLSVLKRATSEIADLEACVGATYQQIIVQLKYKHNTSLLKDILPTTAGSEWGECAKANVISLLKEFNWWINRIEEVDLFDGLHESARDLLDNLEKPLLKSLKLLGDIHQVNEANWDLDERVFDNIIKKLPEYNSDFESEWLEGLESFNHFNAYTKNEYSCLYSWLYLTLVSRAKNYGTNLWATKKQWKQLGYELKEDAQPAPVVHFFQINQLDGEERLLGKRKSGDLGRKVSIVYNSEDVIGTESKNFASSKVKELSVIDGRLVELEVEVFEGQDSAFYDRTTDVIFMPRKELFRAKDATKAYYATLLHELVHWTGHESRCGRKFGSEFGDADYILEELVAELGSSFLCSRFGLTKQVRLQSISYIKSWLGRLNDEESIGKLETAARLANKASNYIYIQSRDCID